MTQCYLSTWGTENVRERMQDSRKQQHKTTAWDHNEETVSMKADGSWTENIWHWYMRCDLTSGEWCLEGNYMHYNQWQGIVYMQRKLTWLLSLALRPTLQFTLRFVLRPRLVTIIQDPILALFPEELGHGWWTWTFFLTCLIVWYQIEGFSKRKGL